MGLMVAAVSLAVAITVRPAFMPRPSLSDTGRPTLWGEAGHRTAARMYRSPRVSGHPRLVVVIHGDAPGHNPSYQYAFAEAVATALDDVVVLAVLRPGYRDDAGARSDGHRGLTVGDNYTSEAAIQLRRAVGAAARSVQAGDVVLVGHSGGAALAMLMLAQEPGLASGAIIASCPCDLPAWRRHMARRRFNPLFLGPVGGLSPMDQVGALSRGLRLRILVGGLDDVAPPDLSRALAVAAQAHGLDARLRVVPGAGHEVLQNPATLAELQGLLATPADGASPRNP